MGHVSVRYDAVTGQPYVIRVTEDEGVPPLEPAPGEEVVVTTVEEYKKHKSHDAFLRAAHPKMAAHFAVKDEEEQRRQLEGGDQDPESQAIGIARAAAQAAGDEQALAALDLQSEALAASQTPPPDEIE